MSESNNLKISLQYHEIRELLISVYKSGVGSYEDLADIVVDNKLDEIISGKYITSLNSITFELSNKEPQKVDPLENSVSIVNTNFSTSTSFTYTNDTIINSEVANLPLSFTSY